MPVVDTVYTDGNAEAFAVSAFTATAQGSAGAYSTDNVNPAVCQSISNTKPVALYKAGSEFMTATFTAFTSDGVTFSYSDFDGTARQRAVLFIEAGVTAYSIAADAASYTLTGQEMLPRLSSPLYLRYRK
jgi:hypothetical protein